MSRRTCWRASRRLANPYLSGCRRLSALPPPVRSRICLFLVLPVRRFGLAGTGQAGATGSFDLCRTGRFDTRNSHLLLLFPVDGGACLALHRGHAVADCPSWGTWLGDRCPWRNHDPVCRRSVALCSIAFQTRLGYGRLSTSHSLTRPSIQLSSDHWSACLSCSGHGGLARLVALERSSGSFCNLLRPLACSCIQPAGSYRVAITARALRSLQR